MTTPKRISPDTCTSPGNSSQTFFPTSFFLELVQTFLLYWGSLVACFLIAQRTKLSLYGALRRICINDSRHVQKNAATTRTCVSDPNRFIADAPFYLQESKSLLRALVVNNRRLSAWAEWSTGGKWQLLANRSS